jgi:hypothetical protein
MLARLRIRLPFAFQVPEGAELLPTEREFGEYRIRYHPALAAAHAPAPAYATLEQLANALEPTDTPTLREDMTVDGGKVYDAEILQIDFVAKEFDRRLGHGDPPDEVLLAAAADWLARLRHVGRAAHVRLPEPVAWELQYLNDDETELAATPGQVRRRGALAWTYGYVLHTQEVWKLACELPQTWRPPIWDKLLLDADASGDLGAKVVLAFTALEVFIALTLDELARRSTIQPALWAWLTNRGNYLRDPAADEQFDTLLQVLTGVSLKSAPGGLWSQFTDLRSARNKFAHEGEATLHGAPVDFARAVELVGSAVRIMLWVEDYLPEDLRRPRTTGRHEVSMTRTITESVQPPTS